MQEENNNQEAFSNMVDNMFEEDVKIEQKPTTQVEQKKPKKAVTNKQVDAVDKEEPHSFIPRPAQPVEDEEEEDNTTRAEKKNAQQSNTEDAEEKPERLKSLEAEIEKSKKTVADNVKFARTLSGQLKKGLEAVKGLIESGSLGEEDAQGLLSALQNPHMDEIESNYESTNHPFTKMFKIADTELANMRKYSSDELIDDKVKAFNYFLHTGSQEEIETAWEALNKLASDPIALTKKMLTIGQNYYDDSYKDIKEAGGFKILIQKKNAEIEKLTKKLDKMAKKLSEYEDYDTPTYGLKEMGYSEGDQSKDSMDQLFDS